MYKLDVGLGVREGDIGSDSSVCKHLADRHSGSNILAARAPDILYQAVKLFDGSIESHEDLGLVAGNGHTGISQLLDAAQHLDGYHAHIVKPQYAIAHTCGGYQLTIVNLEDILNYRRTHEVIVVGIGELWHTGLVAGCNIGILTVIVSYVGDKLTLTQEITAAGEVVGPCAGLACPSLIAVEPLAPKTKANARHLIINRLVGRGVDDEEVQTAGHSGIGGRFEDSGGIHEGTIAEAIGCKRLCCSYVLSIDMGNRSRLTDITLVLGDGYESLLVTHPDGRHGYIGAALAVHTVGSVGAPRLMTLRISLQAVGLEDVSELVVVVLCHHVADSGTPVEEEALGFLSTVDNDTCQRGKPGEQVVATAGLELFHHLTCPCLGTGFVTVIEQVGNATVAHQSLAGIDISLEIILIVIADSHGVYLVNLETGSFRRSGMVGLSCESVAESHDTPTTLGSFPGKHAVLDKRGNIDNVCRVDNIGSGRSLDRRSITIERRCRLV